MPGSLAVSSAGAQSKTSSVVVGGPPPLPARYVAQSSVCPARAWYRVGSVEGIPSASTRWSVSSRPAWSGVMSVI